MIGIREKAWHKSISIRKEGTYMGNANSSTKIAERLEKRKCLFGCSGE